MHFYFISFSFYSKAHVQLSVFAQGICASCTFDNIQLDMSETYSDETSAVLASWTVYGLH